VFDFVEETKKALESLPRELNSVDHFAEVLASILYHSLVRSNQPTGKSQIAMRPEWIDTLADGSPTTISLDGYYDSDDAVQRELVFDYRGYAPFHIEKSGRWIGSKEVIKVLWDRGDPRLAAYKMESPTTLSDAISIAKKYIRAYSESEAHIIDPKTCSRVGGRPHIATITPSEGFRWVPRFEPL
jgi:hypothetical protein